MPPKRKKKVQAGNARGFATTSIPTKAHATAIAESAITGAEADITCDKITSASDGQSEEETRAGSDRVEQARLLSESTQIVDQGKRMFTKTLADMDVEKRSRKACIQLTLSNTVIDRILSLAQSQAFATTERLSPLDSMKYLYAGELMMKSIGLEEESIHEVLLYAPHIATVEDLLCFVSITQVLLASLICSS